MALYPNPPLPHSPTPKCEHNDIHKHFSLRPLLSPNTLKGIKELLFTWTIAINISHKNYLCF